ENKMLKKENELLKVQFALATEELDVYKNPRTSTLCLVLKYPVHSSQNNNSQATSEN
ncbi:11865_t:CDS:1, partial [Dentiscutata heterogama]